MLKSIFAGIRRLIMPAKPTPKPAPAPAAKKAEPPPPRSKPPQKKKTPPHQSKPDSRENRREQRKKTREQSPVRYTPREVPPMIPIVVPEAEEGKTRFHDLNLDERILAGTQTLGFTYCTPVQAQAIPAGLTGRDIMGKSQTGTGKTAAFLTVIFDRFLKNPRPERKIGSCRALILAPTRELAIQIHKDAEAIGAFLPLHNVVVFGGMDHKQQSEAIHARPVDLLIGTPGRMIDYMMHGVLDVSQTEILVIDEADRMLDMGFIPDVSRIVNRLPRTEDRQTFFFSATFTPEVNRLAERWLKNPVSIEIDAEHVVTELITQKFYSVMRDRKFDFLCHFLAKEVFTRVLIFGNRRDFNSDLAAKLRRAGFPCELLSGDVPQEKRLKVLEKFRSGTVKILVATDVAARGIHVEGISHVINFDLPEQSEDYVHRIGRTGRAGVPGNAVSFVCEYGAYAIDGIERYIGHTITSEQPPEEMLLPYSAR